MPKGSFRGGVHPPENKERTATLRTVVARRPSQVAIALHQGSNCPLTPTVAKGDYVRMGQKVADTDEKWGVPAHSPVSGKVVSIGLVRTASGVEDQAIFIEPDGEDALDESCVPVDNVFSRSPEEIIKIIRDAGIVGMGGAEFPTHIKLSLPPGANVDTLLLNGAECEPYLTADHRLMVERPRDIIRGAQIMMRAIGVSRTLIGIEDNKPDAIRAMGDAASSAAGVEVVAVKTRYPQGSEKHLIKSVLGREVPPGGLPFTVGVVVSNVGTCAAVSNRFDRGLPLIERIVTVTGSAVAKPANLVAKIGTSASDLIEECGGFVGQPGKIVFGGPMMGMAVSSVDVPIGKGTSGILVMSREESEDLKEMPCIKCGQCVDACPMRLEPVFLHQWSNAGLWDEAEAYHAMDCIECGVCTYVCPSRRNLVQAIKRAKFEISARRRAAKERGSK